jgi:mannose-6-phosphate isomerase-like protein (cupin superfamily)
MCRARGAGGLVKMDIVDTSALWQFAAQKMQKVNLFETDRMFCDIYCFEPGQVQAPHGHADSDKVYFVLSGRGRFQVGNEEHRLGPNQATIAPAGAEHGVVNDSAERLVVLVFMAPHPGRRLATTEHGD